MNPTLAFAVCGPHAGVAPGKECLHLKARFKNSDKLGAINDSLESNFRTQVGNGVSHLERRGEAGSSGELLEASVTGRGRGRGLCKYIRISMSQTSLRFTEEPQVSTETPCAPLAPCSAPTVTTVHGWGPRVTTEKPSGTQRACELAFTPPADYTTFPEGPAGSQGPSPDSPAAVLGAARPFLPADDLDASGEPRAGIS